MSGHLLVVVGIGHDGPGGLSAEARAHVGAARILAGGNRHLDFFPEWARKKIVIDANLDAVVGNLREVYRSEKTVVLASGDPLFYGIGNVLLREFPREDLLFLPTVTSVQLACARLKVTWHDARVISLHGRPLESLKPALESGEDKIALLTDGKSQPAAIAALLRQCGVADDYSLWVCENLGGADERVSRHLPGRMGEVSFSPLNVVVLLREGSPPSPKRQTVENPAAQPQVPVLGIPEKALLHRPGPRGLITRREVRVMALCHLELGPSDVLWDIGAGSGSVSIEAARLAPGLRAFAVERDGEMFHQLEANVARFAPNQVRPVLAEAPGGLSDLPNPDAVFIGGSGSHLGGILDQVQDRLRPGGRLVLNCITLETLTLGWEWLRSRDLNPEVTSVQLAHSRSLGRWHSLEPDLPIFILRARKP